DRGTGAHRCFAATDEGHVFGRGQVGRCGGGTMGGGGRPTGRHALTRIRRIGSVCHWVALAVVAALSPCHPPTFDPRDVSHALHEITQTPYWSPIHGGVTVGVCLLGVGMLCWHRALAWGGAASYSSVAIGVAWLGVVLLLVALVLEAAGGHALARAFVAGGHDPAVLALLGVLWAGVLAYA